MEINAQVNTFEGGLDMDTDISRTASNTYRYAQNMRLITNEDGTSGILQSIDYIKKYKEIPALSNQTILYTIAARVPDENEILQNTAILITQDKSSESQNNIYLVTGFDQQELSCKCILKILWHMTEESNVQLIYNYETRNVYKLYVNDSNTGLKILNLADYTQEWGDKEPIQDPDFFNGQPTAVLPPLTLEQFINGNLKAGAYQYFYKLYTDTGIESTLSAGSEVIYLARPNINNGSLAEGYTEEYTTNYGIQLRINTTNDYFNRIRLYRVYWKDNINIPTVEIITEDKISKQNLNYTINDSTQQAISEITLEELNDFIPYTFHAKTMTQYKNRLFFANLEADGWDIPEDYDTRAYRANYQGRVTLTNTAGSNIINNVNLSDIVNGTVTIDSTADCINPMNQLDLYPDAQSTNEYAYDTGKSYGGEGPNIEFHLVFGETYETPYGRSTGISENANTTSYDNKTAASRMANRMSIEAANGTVSYDSINFPTTQLLSYSNPYISSKFASYQRDETYRFGIVFYNEKFIASPVHWICDIRIPSADTAGFQAFDVNTDLNCEVKSKPIGINFAIKANKFPEGAVAAEIVRCDRTEADRTIVSQGMINNPVFYYHPNMHTANATPNVSNGSNDIRPTLFPTMDELPQATFGCANHVSFVFNRCYDVKLFASPEVCMNPNSDVIQEGDYLCPVRVIWSVMRDTDNDDYIKVCYEDATTDTTNTFGVIRGDTGESLLCFDPPSGANTVIGAVKYYLSASANDFYKTFGPSSSGKNADSEHFILNINQARVARTDLPTQDNGGLAAYKGTYIDNISSRQYTNTAVGGSLFSIAGINALLGVDFPSNNATQHILYKAYATPPYNSVSSWANVRSVLVNVKRRVTQYGGNSYLARAANGYISCGGFITKNAGNKTIFGGDTFLTIFNYQHAIPFTKNNYADNPVNDGLVSDDNDDYKVYYHQGIQVFLPVESTINTYMRSDSTYAKLAQDESDDRFYLQTNPGVLNAHTQDVAMYQYNSVYSLSDGALNYSMGSTNQNISTNEFNRYRICCTEQKSAGEEVDSWAITKFANTLDLDFRYGAIHNLVDFNSRLYAIQESAVSVIGVGDRSLITDQNGAELVLGTGGILSRYDILVYNYGTGRVNDKSVITSSQNIYWYDSNKNVICALGNNGFHLLSKEKKVQSYLNSVAQLGDSAFTAVFNDRLNELWMQTKGRALVFSEQADLFTSFYTHTPDWGLRFYDRLVTLDNKQFYYTDTFGEEDIVKEMTANVTFVVNDNPLYTKVFDNQWLQGNLEDPQYLEPRNISSIKFHTKTQDSFEINYEDIECREDTYRFPIPRQDRSTTGTEDEAEQDILNKSFLPRMRGKYLTCEYTFDCNQDRSIEIPFIKTTYRYSRI